MDREPVGLYVFCFIIGLGLFTFVAMNYWSSQLIEKDIKTLRLELSQIRKDTQHIQEESRQVHRDIVNIILDDQKNDQELLKGILSNSQEISEVRKDVENAKQEQKQEKQNPQKKPLAPQKKLSKDVQNREKKSTKIPALSLSYYDPVSKNRPHMDPDSPNLLTEDPFTKEVLPKLLGKNFQPKGTRKTAIVGKPPDLHPMRNESTVQNMQGLCNASLSRLHFGKYETMAPDMALKIEERFNRKTKSKEYWVHLRDDLFWEPLDPKLFPEDFHLDPWFLRRHQVTSEDFKFYVDAIQNVHVQKAAPYRNYWGDIQEIVVIDDLTFIVRWKSKEDTLDAENKQIKYTAKSLTGGLKPLASFVYKYFSDGKKIIADDSQINTYKQNSIWAQNFSEHWAKNVIVSCGPWILDQMSDERAYFRRNPNFYNRFAVLVQGLEVSFKASPDLIWQDYKSGALDTYSLVPDQIIEFENFKSSSEYQDQVAKGKEIHRLDYLSRVYHYIGWNQTNVFFNSRTVRQAMTLAIDRKRIIDQNLNGMGVEITGPFFTHSPSNDSSITPWPYDPGRAKQLLEEEGWYDSDGEGIRDKLVNGQRVPFSFSLSYYVKNPVTRINCQYIATALKEIGVECKLNGLDIMDLSNLFAEKSFDAIYFGWALGTPPENPRQLWHSSGAHENGSSNAVAFSHEEADSIIEQLDYEYDMKKRQALYHRFHRILHHEAPYTFLYTPKTSFLYRDYVKNVFIPADRQDLVPGANIAEPQSEIFWIKEI